MQYLWLRSLVLTSMRLHPGRIRFINWTASDVSSSSSWSVDFINVLMHALSRDTCHFPHACIYCQIGSTDDDDTTELRLVPADANQCKSALHPLVF